MKKQLRIGTRGSALALAQATLVQNQLQDHHPQITVELEIIKTTGDKIQDVPLAKIGGKGLFTKEIEMAILAGEVDLGVHSMKDVPTEVPDGLVIGITTIREDPRDAFISRKYQSLRDIPGAAASAPAACAVRLSSCTCVRTWRLSPCGATWTRVCASWWRKTWMR